MGNKVGKGFSIERHQDKMIEQFSEAWNTSSSGVVRLSIDLLRHMYISHRSNHPNLPQRLILKELKKQILEWRKKDELYK